MIKTVLFDIDGTLYDYDSANASAMDALCEYASEQFGWTREQFLAAHKKAFDALKRAARETAATHDRLIRYSMMMEEAGLPLSHALVMNDLYWDTLIDVITPYPYVKEAIQSLRASGLKTGIGTNMTAYVQYLKLQKLGLLDLFDFIVTSEETPDEKPGPSVFLRCLERARCTPSECVFIGDSLEKDVYGAQKVGIYAILYDQCSVLHASMDNDDIIRCMDYRELVPLIQSFDQSPVRFDSIQVTNMRTPQKDLDSRHQEILKRLHSQKEFRSEAFAQEFGISMMTVRRDLQLLEEQGFLKRTHGGAVAIEGNLPDNPLTSEILACREAISRYAALYVNDGDRLFINGSRTALNLLKYVEGRQISVYTNNGWAIGETYPDGVNIRMVGGDLHDHIMVGEFTMRNLLDLKADKTFIGCYAVYDDGEFSYSIPTEIGINEAMIGRTTDRLYILADHTKLHSHEIRDTAYGSCTYDRPITLITDSLVRPDIVENLRSLGMEIIQVPVQLKD